MFHFLSGCQRNLQTWRTALKEFSIWCRRSKRGEKKEKHGVLCLNISLHLDSGCLESRRIITSDFKCAVYQQFYFLGIVNLLIKNSRGTSGNWKYYFFGGRKVGASVKNKMEPSSVIMWRHKYQLLLLSSCTSECLCAIVAKWRPPSSPSSLVSDSCLFYLSVWVWVDVTAAMLACWKQKSRLCRCVSQVRRTVCWCSNLTASLTVHQISFFFRGSPFLSSSSFPGSSIFS